MPTKEQIIARACQPQVGDRFEIKGAPGVVIKVGSEVVIEGGFGTWALDLDRYAELAAEIIESGATFHPVESWPVEEAMLRSAACHDSGKVRLWLVVQEDEGTGADVESGHATEDEANGCCGSNSFVTYVDIPIEDIDRLVIAHNAIEPPAHAPDCAVATNARHECSCAAPGPAAEIVLLPCPFCGRSSPSVRATGEAHAARCSTCNATGPACPTFDQAIAQWNKRATEPAPPGGERCGDSSRMCCSRRPDGQCGAAQSIAGPHGDRPCPHFGRSPTGALLVALTTIRDAPHAESAWLANQAEWALEEFERIEGIEGIEGGAG